AAGEAFSELDLLVDRRACHDDEVVGLAVGEPLLNVERSVEERLHPVSRRLLELRHELEIRLLRRLGRNHVDFRGADRGRKQRSARCDDRCRPHVRPPVTKYMFFQDQAAYSSPHEARCSLPGTCCCSPFSRQSLMCTCAGARGSASCASSATTRRSSRPTTR